MAGRSILNDAPRAKWQVFQPSPAICAAETLTDRFAPSRSNRARSLQAAQKADLRGKRLFFGQDPPKMKKAACLAVPLR